MMLYFEYCYLIQTAAFALPTLERLLFRPKRIPAIRVLILTPTRELAVQLVSSFLYFYLHGPLFIFCKKTTEYLTFMISNLKMGTPKYNLSLSSLKPLKS